ncbi:uncharacterized protein LOC131673824 [Phymastichus coffea]|uniref:uncharacterized protein LOC131673824 n=1 Tax=Phymastichus coffea TaxID=108790 RepID=UPI00273CCB1B|nr:uncharacterized protein LOC131673824 [Phymastichus coffea]
MEVKQFYNKTISPLVINTFSCKWSQDNRLSIVTEKVVHVFEIKPAPHQATPILNLSRSFINSPKAMPSKSYEDEIVSKIFDWKKENVYSFLKNDTYTPEFPKTKVLKPEIINVFWSPKGLLHPQKCLLAVLTSAGSLEITVQIEKNWFLIHELSKDWFKIIDEDFKSLRETVIIDAACLKEQLNRLLVTNAAWSSLHHRGGSASFAYLVTAHRNAEIVIWKVHRVLADTVYIDTRINVEFKFRKKLTEDSSKINTMLWVDLGDNKYLLFVGFYNGQIGVLKLQEFEGGLTCSLYSVCFNEDRIIVNSMEILQQTSKQLELLAVKDRYLLILTVDIFGKMISMKFIMSPGFSITGVSIINSNNILMVTQDGKICMVQKSHGKELTYKPLKSDIAKDALQYLGLISSRNKLLHILVSSPAVMYDHLRNREPTNLCFFTLHDLQSQNVINDLYNNEEQSLIDYWDYLELIKVSAVKRGMLPAINYKIENLDFMSLYELKVTYWNINIMETVRKKNSPDEDYRQPKEIEQVKTYIFFYSASMYLQHLTRLPTLTDNQKLSMSLVRNHLDIWYAGEEEETETPLSLTVKEILEATGAFDLIQQEKCNFCEELITEPWALSCLQGHKLPRCALTRLQVTCTKYRTCPICQEVYHPCLDDEMSEVKCIYCDIPVVYMYLKIDPQLLTSTRNLSKVKLIFIGSNKEKDKEKDEEDDA